MRVTEGKMMAAAGEALAKARERSAKAGDLVSGGLRVSKPSDDPAMWAEGMRASARNRQSEARGSAIGLATDRLRETEITLDSVDDTISRAYELAIQLGNDVHNPEERGTAASEVDSLRARILELANARGSDGEYLFAGSLGNAAPFDATTGAYVGDLLTRSIEAAEGELQPVTVPGTVFTTTSGVDILAELDALSTALRANDGDGIRATIDTLSTGIGQIGDARSLTGTRLAALESADEGRLDLEVRLKETYARSVEADPFEAASEFAQSRVALEIARTAAEQIIALARPRT